MPRMFAAAFTHLPELLSAYRHGGGVSWQALGADARECQAALNRPWFDQRLGAALAGVDHLHRVLSQPGARILDVGFGAGWSTIALAQAYPQATFTGLDVDVESVAMARRMPPSRGGRSDRLPRRRRRQRRRCRTGRPGLRIRMRARHATTGRGARPRCARAAPGASLVVMDEAVSDRFAGPADDVDRLMYAFSLFVCLPDGMSSEPSVGTGTVMRPSVLEQYAVDAGFVSATTLPIDDFAFFRFYELTT